MKLAIEEILHAESDRRLSGWVREILNSNGLSVIVLGHDFEPIRCIVTPDTLIYKKFGHRSAIEKVRIADRIKAITNKLELQIKVSTSLDQEQ
jgi:hypothetical protein